MAIFLVDIPPGAGKPSGLKARVEAASWMVALAAGLEQLGYASTSLRDVSADIRDDGTVLVTDRSSGRVFRIQEIAKRSSTRADAPKARGKPPTSKLTGPKPPPVKPIAIEPLAPLPKNAPAIAWKEYAAESAADKTLTATFVRPVPAGVSHQDLVTLPPALAAAISASVKKAAWGGFGIKTLDALLHVALEQVPAESASVYVVDPRDGTLRICAAWGPRARRILEQGVELKRGAGVAGFCAVKGVTLALSDVERDPRFNTGVARDLDYAVRSLLTAPIIVTGQSVACLQLLNRKGATVFSPLDIAALSLVAKEAGEQFARLPPPEPPEPARKKR